MKQRNAEKVCKDAGFWRQGGLKRIENLQKTQGLGMWGDAATGKPAVGVCGTWETWDRLPSVCSFPWALPLAPLFSGAQPTGARLSWLLWGFSCLLCDSPWWPTCATSPIGQGQPPPPCKLYPRYLGTYETSQIQLETVTSEFSLTLFS